MLVLARKQNQRITATVPPSSKETVIEIIVASFGVGDHGGMHVRLGFNADRKVKIWRSELEHIASEGVRAPAT